MSLDVSVSSKPHRAEHLHLKVTDENGEARVLASQGCWSDLSVEEPPANHQTGCAPKEPLGVFGTFWGSRDLPLRAVHVFIWGEVSISPQGPSAFEGTWTLLAPGPYSVSARRSIGTNSL